MKREKSCGAVVWFAQNNERLYLIEQMRGGHFAMPKGHMEPGESEAETAEREIWEETGLRVRADTGFRAANAYSPYASIEIADVRFVDENNSNTLDAEEHARLVFIIRNTGRDYVYDIAPVITVTGTKEIYLSPTAIVKELAPGKAVRYQSEIIATRKLKNGTADFSIGLSDGDKLYTLRSFQMRTRKR